MELVCCVCGKLKVNGHWMHAKIPENTLLSHGYCLSCMNEVLDEIKKLHNDKNIDKAVA